MTSKTALLEALARFIAQRPGMDPRNYGDWRAYRAEARGVTRDRQHAEALLRAVLQRDSVTADMLIDAAGTGRLQCVIGADGAVSVDYTTGQYFPTEYRAAAARVLAGALWAWYRSNGAATGDAIRAAARRDLGATLARRFFN